MVAKRTPRLTVLFDADCGFCGRSAMLVHRLDRYRRIRFTPLQRSDQTVPGAPSLERLMESIHAVDDEGQWTSGSAAWLRIMDLVPLLRPVAVAGRLPRIRDMVEPVYAIVAAHRHQLSRLLGASACRYRPPAPRDGTSTGGSVAPEGRQEVTDGHDRDASG